MTTVDWHHLVMRELSISIYFSKLKLFLKISQSEVADAPGSENGGEGGIGIGIYSHPIIAVCGYFNIIVLYS